MKVVNRWVYVIVGCVALLLSGLVYAWSVLSGPIAAEFPQWSAAQLSLTFTIVMSFFCIGGLVGGFLAGKVSQKVYLWVSAALFLVGFLLSANIRSLAMLYIGFGVICGFASGFSVQRRARHGRQVVSRQAGTDLRHLADGLRHQQLS